MRNLIKHRHPGKYPCRTRSGVILKNKPAHAISWKQFVSLKFKKEKNFPKALKAAAKDWPKAKTMSPAEAKKTFGSIYTRAPYMGKWTNK